MGRGPSTPAGRPDDHDGPVAVVDVDRPDAEHAIDSETALALREAWKRFAAGEGRGGAGVADSGPGARDNEPQDG